MVNKWRKVKDNVILFFKGAFNQNSLLNLLSIVESQLHESTITVKIYNLMVEMLQNISKHADNFSQEMDWKPGIFLITETEDNYILISGNYIRNEKIERAWGNKKVIKHSLLPCYGRGLCLAILHLI